MLFTSYKIYKHIILSTNAMQISGGVRVKIKE
jgi:hypothetical protein